MARSVVSSVFCRCVDDPVFRRNTLRDLGSALAEEGFVLNDDEMRVVREFWETLAGQTDRTAHERILARARSLR